MSLSLTPPLKWHGGKHYLARRLLELMPGHLHYVEPYAGGLAVLLAKSPDGVSEVVNDLDGALINFWRTLQAENTFGQFRRIVEATPFSEQEWEDARHSGANTDCPVWWAAAFFVRVRQSMAGRATSFAPLTRNRTRRGMNEQASAWLSAVDGLPEVHARLRRVVVLNRPALDVIRSQDGANTLFYLDPPYLHETRTAPDVYGPFEMARSDHITLLEQLAGVEGKFMLSGYRSALYDNYASVYGWRRVDFDLANHAASGDEKRRMTESVWMNY